MAGANAQRVPMCRVALAVTMTARRCLISALDGADNSRYVRVIRTWHSVLNDSIIVKWIDLFIINAVIIIQLMLSLAE